VFFAAAAMMAALGVRDFFKAPKKSPEHKAAVWGMAFYGLFAALGVLLIVFGILHL
jgi:hypothetical protein